MVMDFSFAWSQFTEMVAYRLSTKGGPDWNHWQAFYGQFIAYEMALLWNQLPYRALLALGAIGWAIGLVGFTAVIGRYRRIEDICALIAFLLIALVVFLRYFLMVNHSFEHWFIVSRYIFILLAVGVSAALYSLLQLCGWQRSRAAAS
jgi:hypothetical protein